MSEMVLDLLKGSSAQAPIGFDQLVSETGLLPKTMAAILDSLYAKRVINEAAVTKNGITERVVWLSGVVAPAVRQSLVIHPKKIQLTGQLGLHSQPASAADKVPVDIPLFLRNQQNLREEKAEAVESTEKPAPTTKVYKALKFIEANPNCSTASISEAIEIDLRNVANCLSIYIKNGDVVVTKHGRSSGTYQLTKPADEAYLGKGRYQKKSANSGEPNENGQSQTNQAAALDQPANALLEWDASGKQNQIGSGAEESTQEAAHTNAVATELHEMFEEAFSPLEEFNVSVDRALNIEAPKPAESGNFRVAYTNDGCLMLMGLEGHFLPIELNAAQTNDLIEFISDQIMPIGVAI